MNLTTSQRWGLGLLLALLLFAIISHGLSPYSISQQQLTEKLLAPNAAHWFGTDHLGRDMLTRLASAVGLSLLLSGLCVLTAAILGVTLGLVAAWQGGRAEQLCEVMVNILLALPGLVLVLMLAAIAPGSFIALYLAISLVQWVEYYRVTRAISKPLLASPELQASQMMGFGRRYLLRRHLWPKLAPSIFTMAAFGGANAILMMASLGFVYVGIQPPTAELGLMAVELFPYYSQAPWVLLQPLLMIGLLVLSLQLLAGGTNQQRGAHDHAD
ncbi:ABC transporter permease [Ferrimonas senticii]|uniref:ABC transporter permease n=1 Tax=Ferrimonas senticii TaxID=394566 RepID=UPI00041EDDB6|nr:ABC transporter permease [Ferrimonas senticii]